MISSTELLGSILETSKNHLLRVSLMNEIESTPNYGRSPKYLWNEVRVLLEEGKVKSIFDFLNIPDNPENRFKVIHSTLKIFISNNKWLVDSKIDMPEDEPNIVGINLHFANLIIDLDNLLNGTISAKTDDEVEHVLWHAKMNDPKSLVRHLMRSGTQASILVNKIDNEKAQTQNTSKSELKWSIPIAWFHDIGRLISQMSDHDDWGEKLISTLKIRTEIKNAKHKSVPIVGDIDDFNPREFDTPTQSISRIVDVGGKVDLTTKTLRESVEEIRRHSENTQIEYLKKEDPFWANIENPEQAIKNYTLKEAKSLEHAIRILKEIGVDWLEIVKDLNTGGHNTQTLLAEVAK